MENPVKRSPNPKTYLKKKPENIILSPNQLTEKYNELSKENQYLDEEIAKLNAKNINSDLQPEIKALHAYNEIKDLAQIVIGHLAEVEGVSVKKLHKRYRLPLE